MGKRGREATAGPPAAEDADAEEAAAKLARKLSRALARGDEARAAALRARGAVVAEAAPETEVPVAPEASAEAPVDGGGDGGAAKLSRKLARALARGDDARAAALRTRIAQLEGPAAPPPAAPADPHEGMVLARNGKWYPRPVPAAGNTSLLLFYAYVVPPWTQRERAAAVEFAHTTLTSLGCFGRLRVACEGFNSTLSGTAAGVRAFTEALKEWMPQHFGRVDFKFVDGLPDNKAFKTLKVMPVEEMVTYGFKAEEAPLSLGGTHVSPAEWTKLAAEPGTLLVDVRNANETAIGRFVPPPGGAKPLDPRMRRSTEFPDWVASHIDELKAAPKVMMCCTAGVRCERASALLAQAGVPRDHIVQLDGGIHRYLDAFPEDGGIWAGKNYTFDKRFSHGAEKQGAVVGRCAGCDAPWERYQAQATCVTCKMEVLLCKDCQVKERKQGKGGAVGGPPLRRLLCWLCTEAAELAKSGGAKGAAAAAAAAKARAFAAAGGGRDGEGEGRGSAALHEDDAAGGAGGKRKR